MGSCSEKIGKCYRVLLWTIIGGDCLIAVGDFTAARSMNGDTLRKSESEHEARDTVDESQDNTRKGRTGIWGL